LKLGVLLPCFIPEKFVFVPIGRVVQDIIIDFLKRYIITNDAVSKKSLPRKIKT